MLKISRIFHIELFVDQILSVTSICWSSLSSHSSVSPISKSPPSGNIQFAGNSFGLKVLKVK